MKSNWFEIVFFVLIYYYYNIKINHLVQFNLVNRTSYKLIELLFVLKIAPK